MAGADDANERLTPTSSDEAVKWVPAVFDTPGGGAGGAASHRRPTGTIYMDVAKTGLPSFVVNPEVFFFLSDFIILHQPTSTNFNIWFTYNSVGVPAWGSWWTWNLACRSTFPSPSSSRAERTSAMENRSFIRSGTFQFPMEKVARKTRGWFAYIKRCFLPIAMSVLTWVSYFTKRWLNWRETSTKNEWPTHHASNFYSISNHTLWLFKIAGEHHLW